MCRYTVAMVQMFGVFVMAGGSWMVLGEDFPPAMWLALIVSMVGSGMVLQGRTNALEDQGSTGLSHKDMLGQNA